jgi:hypothetical protein
VNDPSDLVAVIINNIALQISDKNEQLLRIRSALNPYKATGRELRDVIEYRGLTAKKGSPTTAIAIFTNMTPGILMPSGTVLSDDGETKLFVTESDVIANSGEIVTPVETGIHCTQTGSILLLGNELTKIVPPIAGLTFDKIEAINVSVGTSAETDKDIHLRLNQSVGAGGYGFSDTIDSALMNLNGVKSATTYVGDMHDIPQNTMCCVVSGGNDSEIAAAIFEKNMFLLKYLGNTTVEVKSAYLNRTYLIRFERPATEILKIKVQIKTFDKRADNINIKILADIITFLQQFGPGSVIYIADMIMFVNNGNNLYKIVSGVFDDADVSIAVDWNRTASTNADSLVINYVE